ncbi:ABC transporter ATP-binding protein [bacterium]|nr:ABC transporter ATP-binding protein [bacterium]
MSARPALRASDLTRRFESATAPALDRVSFSLEEGERLAVLGPSGSGKTTLLRLLAGLDAPEDGKIEIGGKLASSPGKIDVAPERREVALVFQGLALFPHMSAAAQVAFFARAKAKRARAEELLSRIGLGARLDARPDELSGGERQRLAVARALAQEPRLLLLDEPFSNLDRERRAVLRDDLRALLDSLQTTVVLVTHAREDALALASRLLILDAGRAVAHGSIEDLVLHPRRAEVVRALALGAVVRGSVSGPGEVSTPFGPARARLDGQRGSLALLVRPEQARVLGEDELGGTPGEVVSLDLVAPEARSLRHEALVRVGEEKLRARVAAPLPTTGARVRVALEGELEPLEG